MHHLVQNLNPQNTTDLEWNYNDIDPIIPDEVHTVTKHFNDTQLTKLLTPLQALVQTDNETGIDYIELDYQQASKSTAILHFNPFANGMNDNMLVRAQYLKQVFDGFNVTDKHNKLLPLLSFSAPSGSSINLKHYHRKATAKGEFKVLAQHYLQIVAKHGYTKVKIIGFSQGATMAAAIAAMAPKYNIVVTHLAIGEPANVLNRSRRQVGKDFNSSAKHLNAAIDDSGIEHLKSFYGAGSGTKYILGLARRGRLNTALAGGLGKATFQHDLKEVLAHDTLITVGWGGLNRISPASTMRSLITQSRTSHAKHTHAIHTVEIHDAHHTWSDRLTVLATFYAYALLRENN